MLFFQIYPANETHYYTTFRTEVNHYIFLFKFLQCVMGRFLLKTKGIIEDKLLLLTNSTVTWNFASWTLWVIPHRMTFLLGWSKSFENICELAIYICNFLGSTLSRHEKTALVQSNFSLNTRLLWHNQVRILYLCTYILGPNLWVSYIQYMETCDFSVFQWLCAHLELEC